MYQKIFVPVDDSQTSLNALREACQLAQKLNAQIDLVHVVDLAQFSWGGTGYMQAAEVQNASKDIAEKILSNARTIAQEYGMQLPGRTINSTGEKIADLLVKSAREAQCDLIVMGTHGFSGVMHLLMGSVAEGVVRQAGCPVLLVRRNPD